MPRGRGARSDDGRVPLRRSATDLLSAAFLDRSRRYLIEDFRIRTALDRLPDTDLWWRPNEASNSAGNLVLHLCGNARRWIVAGVAGAPDARDREAEFAQCGGVSRAALT